MASQTEAQAYEFERTLVRPLFTPVSFVYCDGRGLILS